MHEVEREDACNKIVWRVWYLLSHLCSSPAFYTCLYLLREEHWVWVGHLVVVFNAKQILQNFLVMVDSQS
jgi:hypothetical protein